MKQRLTRKNLEQWLRSKPADTPVGDPGSGDSCPIAQFLQESTNEGAWVGRTYWQRDIDGLLSNPNSHPLPMWAQDFVHAVDTGFKKPVLAKQALYLLLGEDA